MDEPVWVPVVHLLRASEGRRASPRTPATNTPREREGARPAVARGESIDSGYDGDAGIVSGPIGVTRLRTEYRVNPLGIDVKQPRLEWWLASRGPARAEADRVPGARRELRGQVGRRARRPLGLRQVRVVSVDPGRVPRLAARFPHARLLEGARLGPRRYRLALQRDSFLGDGPALPTDWTASWIAGSAPLSTAGTQWLWYRKAIR